MEVDGDYGKPKKKYEEVEMPENENSAILGLI